MAPPRALRITSRQREVLDHLSRKKAFSSESAQAVPGFDEFLAEKLAQGGVINKRYEASRGAVYWIRGQAEDATGSSAPAGFIVVLHRDLVTPSGQRENFFLARAPYDGRGITFRRLLRGWMQRLDLRPRDLLSGAMGFELVGPHDAMFDGDHVILDAQAP